MGQINPVTARVQSPSSFVTSLPPSAQSIAEIRAILNDPRLYDSLKSSQISKIIKEEGGYTILTEDGRAIRIDIVFLNEGRSGGWAGPAKFTLEFHPPEII